MAITSRGQPRAPATPNSAIALQMSNNLHNSRNTCEICTTRKHSHPFRWSADELRPIVEEAIRRIEKSEARELDYHLLELFTDQSALSGVEQVFTQHLGQRGCDPQDAMLEGTFLVRVECSAGET